MTQIVRVYVTVDREKIYPIHVRVVSRGSAGYGAFTASFKDKKRAGDAVSNLLHMIEAEPALLSGQVQMNWEEHVRALEEQFDM